MWGTFWLVIWALAILAIGLLAAGWLSGFARLGLERSRIDPAVRHLIVGLVRPLVVLVAVVAALDTVGVDLTAVVAVLGAATLAVGLALRDSLSNIAAGAILLTLRPYRGGDWVDAAGTSGSVAELGLLTTTLKNAQGITITVPNNLIVGAPILNYTRNGLRRADFAFRVDASADLARTRAAILAAVQGDARVLAEPEPFVRVEQIDERGVDLLAGAWLKNEDFGVGRSDLAEAIRDALREAEVPLASRHLAVVAGAS